MAGDRPGSRWIWRVRGHGRFRAQQTTVRSSYRWLTRCDLRGGREIEDVVVIACRHTKCVPPGLRKALSPGKFQNLRQSFQVVVPPQRRVLAQCDDDQSFICGRHARRPADRIFDRLEGLDVMNIVTLSVGRATRTVNRDLGHGGSIDLGPEGARAHARVGACRFVTRTTRERGVGVRLSRGLPTDLVKHVKRSGRHRQLRE